MNADSNNQQWLHWKPVNLDLAGNYETDQIIDKRDSFKILITKITKPEKVEIVFDKSIWAFRRTSESLRQDIFKDLSLTYGDDFYINWSFFKIERSNYLNWLRDESDGISNHLKLIHYVVMTLDDVIDIVANYEPEFKIINK